VSNGANEKRTQQPTEIRKGETEGGRLAPQVQPSTPQEPSSGSASQGAKPTKKES
jgi:hypothetical protein